MNISFFDQLAMRSYTALERESIYQMICGAMSVDGYRAPQESRLVEEIVNLIGLTSEERVASRSLSSEVMTRALKNMDDLKKCYLAKFIAQIVLADGVIDPKENAFVEYYFNLLEIPKM